MLVSAAGSMRLTVRSGSSSASVCRRCAAGSVVVRWTSCPRAASSTATAAAIVVFPTPPLPMTMMSPLPGRSSSSTMVASVGHSCAVACGRSRGTSPVTAPPSSAKRFSTSRPTKFTGWSGKLLRESTRSCSSMAAIVCSSRVRNASASASACVSIGIRPFSARRWFRIPIAASSREVRAASASADWRGRLTRIIDVDAPFPSTSTAERYRLRCFSSPASGPRQEASPLSVSRNPDQAPGSWSSRIVWPVGAVSKMTWS